MRRWRAPALLAAGYAIGSLAAFGLFRASSSGAVFFPPAGVSLAALVLTERKRWPLLLLTIAATEVAVDLSHGQSIRYVWGYALANTAEPLVGAWLLRRHPKGAAGAAHWLGLWAFVTRAVVVAPLVGATVGTATVVWGEGKGNWGSVFGPFWAGDALAVLTVGGTLLAFLSPDQRHLRPGRQVLVGVGLTVTALTVAGFWPSTPLFYLPVPFIALVGVRLASPAPAYLTGLVMAVTANVMSALGHGPWAAVADRPHLGLTTLQCFLALATLTGVTLAKATHDRDLAQEQTTAARLERQRAQILYDSAPFGYVTTDPKGTIIRANETFLEMTGFQRDDLVGARRISQLFSVGGRLYYETHFAPLLRMHGAAQEIAFDIVTSTGDRLPVLINAELNSDDGEPATIRLAILDATQRRSYENELLAERQRAEQFAERLDALQQLTARLAAASTTEEIATAVVRDGIPLMAKEGVLGLADRARPGMVRTWPTFGAGNPVVESLLYVAIDDPLPVTAVIRTGAPLQLRTAAEIRSQFPASWPTYEMTDVVSCLGVPIHAADRCVGALLLGFQSEQAFEDDLIEYAGAISNLIASALERAWLYEHEFQTAHELQQALLPVIDVQNRDLEALTYYRPAFRNNDIGGDWYDLFALDDDSYVVVVGDVVGHDIAAAATMGHLQSAVRLYALDDPSPDVLLRRLDQAVAAIPGSLCTTLFYALYQPSTGRVVYSSAGHPPPLLVAGGSIQLLDSARSTPLGLGVARTVATAELPPGGHLLLYTDGLVETKSAPIDRSIERLTIEARGLATTDAATWCERLLDQRSGLDQFDDMVLMCLSRPDAGPIRF